MKEKHLSTLEYHKILGRLASYANFSAGKEKVRALRPAVDLDEIRWRLETTTEARQLLDARPSTSLGGAHDIRPLAQAASRGKVLIPADLLDVRDTLTGARTLHRTLSRLESQYPHLAHIAADIRHIPEIIDEIDRCLDERGEVRDQASPKLARIRREVTIAHDRLQEKLQNIVSSSQNARYLQEPIVTQREGRYVVPLKADFKGRLPGVVHDVSASGATIFIEPLSVVDLNNEWRELQLAEEQEVQRILAELSGLVGDRVDDIHHTVEALASIDLAFAKARYAEDLEAACPTVVPLEPPKEAEGAHSTLRFLGARHPLLAPEEVVPIDIVLDEDIHVLVITGPNTGGKTVSLKTTGLLAALAQAGLHLPVEEGSAFSPFQEIYADIGDEQSIEQSLSTFSSHMTNILSFLDEADERSLVLLDELGAGTDPAEGAALARALLEHFRNRDATTLVATHYPELKSYAQLTPGVTNASVEFDPNTLRPTYKLTIGLPGRSNALAIAQQLGLPQSIIEDAEETISPEHLRTEELLDDIHRLREEAARAQEAATEAQRAAETRARELQERLENIEEERREILAEAREEAEDELSALRDEVRRLRRRLRVASAPLETVKEVEESMDVLEEELPEPEPMAPEPQPEIDQRPLQEGDFVWVRPLNSKGEVLDIDDGEAEVQVGKTRVRVARRNLELRPSLAPTPETVPSRDIHVSSPPSPGDELHLRGYTVDEGLRRLDQYLDTAFRARLPWVRIVHGKGTGRLRRAVREFVADHPLVSEYRSGRPQEGGDGVTMVKLAQR